MSDAPAQAIAADAGHARRRADWLRVLHRWHWISAALSLAGMGWLALANNDRVGLLIPRLTPLRLQS